MTEPLEAPDRVRIAALDLDGTLLRSDGTVSARTRAVLRKAEQSGLTLLLVTARPPRRVRQIAEQLGARGLAICSNGSVLYDMASGRLLREHRLAPDAISQLVVQLRAVAPGVAFAVEAGASYGCEHAYVIQSEHLDDARDPHMLRADVLELGREGVTKLIVQHRGRELHELLALTRKHAGALATVTHSGAEFVEVAAAGVTKALALASYCEENALSSAQVIAFGDMPNDLPMLQWAGCSVAVANAHPEVLAAARLHTASNDDDGVALVLEQLIAAQGELRYRE
jgi:Cof subfamily protein (haloacid dehalogenase superfamily)